MKQGDAAAAVNRALMSSDRSAEAVRNRVLAYLYDKAVRHDDHRYVSLARIARDLKLEIDRERLRIIVDDLEFRGFAVGRNQPSKGKTLYQITPRGIDSIETDPNRLERTGWSGTDFSSDWTDQKVASIVSEIRKVDDQLKELGLTNEQISQVRAYTSAAIIIIESPKPDSDLIWELLNRASAVAGVIGLFVTALTLLS